MHGITPYTLKKDHMITNNPFKLCPSCFEVWQTRDLFLSEPNLALNGYKADFERLEYGLFFFTHMKADCYSTLAIEVADFMDLYQGPLYSERRTGKPDCPGYCLDKVQLQRCEARCECAFVREIMQIIKKTGN